MLRHPIYYQQPNAHPNQHSISSTCAKQNTSLDNTYRDSSNCTLESPSTNNHDSHSCDCSDNCIEHERSYATTCKHSDYDLSSVDLHSDDQQNRRIPHENPRQKGDERSFHSIDIQFRAAS